MSTYEKARKLLNLRGHLWPRTFDSTPYRANVEGILARLSDKHEKVLTFILRYQDEHDGEPPSQKTIYLSLGMTAWQVSRYVKKLTKCGALSRRGYEAPKAKAAGSSV